MKTLAQLPCWTFSTPTTSCQKVFGTFAEVSNSLAQKTLAVKYFTDRTAQKEHSIHPLTRWRPAILTPPNGQQIWTSETAKPILSVTVRHDKEWGSDCGWKMAGSEYPELDGLPRPTTTELGKREIIKSTCLSSQQQGPADAANEFDGAFIFNGWLQDFLITHSCKSEMFVSKQINKNHPWNTQNRQ